MNLPSYKHRTKTRETPHLPLDVRPFQCEDKPDEDVETYTYALANEIAANAPLTIRKTNAFSDTSLLNRSARRS